jgi:hypothetical protein
MIENACRSVVNERALVSIVDLNCCRRLGYYQEGWQDNVVL